MDPDFQVTIVADHICISFDVDVENGNHFGFRDPAKARLFATSILEIAKYFEEKRGKPTV